MDICPRFYVKKPVFHGKHAPVDGNIVGYAAIIDTLKLAMPMVKPVALVCDQNKNFRNEEWIILPNSYLPENHHKQSEIEALYKQLVFALKYEGVHLLLFSFLTKHYSEVQLTQLVNIEPTGQYSRRIWFIVEWLLGKALEGKENLKKKSYVPVIDPTQQFAIQGSKSPRHLVINNLAGTPEFCPLVRKTQKLKKFINDNLSSTNNDYLNKIQKKIIQRASAFLLLKDSKASFSIEGESPKSKRAARWGKVIGQAGVRDLNLEELKRLQQVVIENTRFVDMGFREKGGFVGEHDRITGQPMPEHISAKWQDLPKLVNGLIDTNTLLVNNDIDAVVSAAIIAFGFVFIHPFEDGNGRIHRYLIHHLLAKKKFSHQGIIFPVSASILNHIEDYRKVLEAHSHPLLDFMEWEETNDHNINVLNDTLDYYRFYDATEQAEFLYDCVLDTIENIIPSELSYLSNYHKFKTIIDDEFEMPDKLVAMLVKFLLQNNGVLSKRARNNEFKALTDDDLKFIEKLFSEVFYKLNSIS